ncbi:MAG: nucleotidyltransferase family protein [Candidatus Wallbacteria bacterium]|nr:nucleotidyltransferase family protein [Candidatus Wallbacteria bacterium]
MSLTGSNDSLIPVILAAGESRRMGFPKAVAMINGRTCASIVISNLRQAGFDSSIFLVLGCNFEKISDFFLNVRNLEIVRNHNWERGPLSSLKAALRVIESRGMSRTGLLLYPVDHPFVQASTLSRLLSSHLDLPQKIIIPIYHARRGHPVVFPSILFRELIDAPEEIGARFVTRQHTELILEIQVSDPGVLKNCNSPADLLTESD